MSAPENCGSADVQCDHDASMQRKIHEKHDSAPDTLHEHRHNHLRDNVHAEHEQGATYSKGAMFNKGTATDSDPRNSYAINYEAKQSKEVDLGSAEIGIDGRVQQKADRDPQTHSLSSFYRRYRIFFHLFIWLLFTG